MRQHMIVLLICLISVSFSYSQTTDKINTKKIIEKIEKLLLKQKTHEEGINLIKNEKPDLIPLIDKYNFQILMENSEEANLKEINSKIELNNVLKSIDKIDKLIVNLSDNELLNIGFSKKFIDVLTEKNIQRKKEYTKNVDEFNKIKTEKLESIIRSICTAQNTKQYNVDEIKSEYQYGKEYGTVNLGKINELQQLIKLVDNNIKNGKVEYKNFTGNDFNDDCSKYEGQTY